MATHAADRPRPRFHGDAGRRRVLAPPGRSVALALHLLGPRQLLKPSAHRALRSPSPPLTLASESVPRTQEFSHLLLGGPLPKSEGGVTSGTENPPTFLSIPAR